MTERCILSWCAGLFDADGGFSASLVKHPKAKQYPYLQYQAVIDMREEVVADIFQRLFGGFKRRKVPKNKAHSATHVWKVTRLKAVDFIRKIRPYLVLKGAQADLILEMASIRPKTTSPITEQQHLQMSKLVAQMHQLNQRGVGKPDLALPNLEESQC